MTVVLIVLYKGYSESKKRFGIKKKQAQEKHFIIYI